MISRHFKEYCPIAFLSFKLLFAVENARHHSSFPMKRNINFFCRTKFPLQSPHPPTHTNTLFFLLPVQTLKSLTLIQRKFFSTKFLLQILIRPVSLKLFWFTAPFLSKKFWWNPYIGHYFEAPLKLIIDKFHKEYRQITRKSNI